MSIDDRIRTATAATAATVREVPPLALPADEPDLAQPDFPRRQARPPWRGWSGWLIPLAAAAAVIVVAAVLVAVRSLPGTGHAAGIAPASGGAATGLPRYGVVLTKTEPHNLGLADLSVIDTLTGKRVAEVKLPDGISFQGVTGAADDRTFVVSTVAVTAGSPDDGRAWYLLRIAPGSSQPTTLTRLPIPVQPSDAVIDGLTLSPDGRTLAVMQWCTVPGACDKGSPGTLRLYSVATGQALRTWTWGKLPDPIPSYGDSYTLSQNQAGLTWLAGGRTLAFTYYAHGQAPAIRTLDTTQAGGDLVDGSRQVFTLPGGAGGCAEAVLTPDGRTVVCGTRSTATVCGPPATATLELDAYSAATGERERVLYRTTEPCTRDGAGALGWVGPGGTVVAMVVTGTLPPGTTTVNDDTKVVIGVVNQGKLTPVAPATLPYDQGPGTIAF